jgi:N utilization substance protein B
MHSTDQNPNPNENKPSGHFALPFALQPGDTVESEVIQDDEMAKPKNVRRENRMLAVQFLYGWDLSYSKDRSLALEGFFGAQAKGREHYQFAEMLVNGVLDHAQELDDAVKAYAQNWTFERIAKVDLAVLRLAIYELKYRRDIPPVVSINEALDIAAIYSHPDAKRFINGILDRVKATLDRPFRTAAKD